MAASRRGVSGFSTAAMTLTSRLLLRPEEDEVVAANPQTFFQMYWSGSRDQMLQRMERARAAGAVGVILTLDWTFSHGRDWGSPPIPERLDARAMLRHAPRA